MNIRETFLNLTQYTIPHGKEDTLREYLPHNAQRDEFGNYFLTIGNSETLFTSHLDTYSTKHEKVNHVIEGNIIKTDGSTILGGDNKTGVCVLLNMIEHNIPGTYYFFAGEEPTAKDGGLFGSKKALAANPNFFKRFKRAICFDRKKEGSIVTRQMARSTCSTEFVESLILQFEEIGLEFHPDETGWWTDTAVFLDIIPEVTNLSSGTYKEHSTDEYVDISYLERVANAALRIDWENLPVVRVAKKESSRTETTVHGFKQFANLKNDQKLFDKVNLYMDMFNFRCLNDDEFEPGLDMIFSQWHKESRLHISIEDGQIYLNGDLVGDIKEFEKMLNIGFGQKVDVMRFIGTLENIAEQIGKNTIPSQILDRFFDKFGTSMEEFIEFYNDKANADLKQFIRFNPKNKSITLLM